MPRKTLSMLDLIGLPEDQSQVAIYLLENGGHTAQDLADALSMELAEIKTILKTLISQGFVSRAAAGTFEINMAQRTSQESPDKESSSMLGDVLDSLINLDDE